MTDHVVLMRMAARLMRERAEAVVRAGERWTFHRPAIASPAYEMHVAAVGDPQWSGVADVVVGTGAAPHIASWHPGVALLVADLLEAAAHWEEEWQRDNPGPCDCRLGADCGCRDPEPGDEAALAAALARAYLGGSAEVSGG